MKEKERVELLAPAGDMASFNSAINNGADAVYLSGKSFGARASATNFSEEELKEIIRTCHLLGKKVYVTVNTLIKDKEFNEALSFVNFLHVNNVDGILIQDLGLAYVLHQIFPNLVLHASTQMNVHSVEMAKRCASLGIKRIVLARECNLDLVKKIKNEVKLEDGSPMEVEVFVHGALCMSYSGNCYLSSFIGKRSGNRGRCAGACRLKYSLVKKNIYDKPFDLEVGHKAYYLSLKELNTLNDVDKLIEAGVDSLKIEGRLKKSEYVGLLVRSYRNAIDNKNVDREKVTYELKEMFNRGFTKGFILKSDNNDMTNIVSPNHQGVELGRTLKVTSKKLGDKYIYQTFIKLDKLDKNDNLVLGDSIRISELEENPDIDKILEDGITLSRMDLCDESLKLVKNINVAHKNDIICINTHVLLHKDMKVLKTSSINLLKEFENDKDSIKVKKAINGFIFVKDNKLALTLQYENIKVTEVSLMDVEVAKSADAIERIKEQVSKINNTYFYFEKLEAKMNQVFLPVKEINDLRRRAIASLEEEIIKNNTYKKDKFKRSNIDTYSNDVRLFVKVRNEAQYEACIELGIKDIITEENSLSNKDGIIYMNPRLSDNPNLTSDGLISSVYMNVINSFSVYYLNKLGVKTVGVSVEASKDEIESLIYNYEHNFNTKPNLMMMVYGYYEVMIMKHCLIRKFFGHDNIRCGECLKEQYYLKDKLDYRFPLIRDNYCNLKMLNSMRLHLINYVRDIIEMGVRNILLDFSIESKEETKEIIENYINAINGNEYNSELDYACYGHYKEEMM